MGVDHVFHAVGDDFPARQAIEHAAVSHGDPVVDGDGVELLGDAARLFDLAGDHLTQVLQVNVARDELSEGIDDGDNRFAEVLVGHARGAPKTARAGHVAAVGGGFGTKFGHCFAFLKPSSDIADPIYMIAIPRNQKHIKRSPRPDPLWTSGRPCLSLQRLGEN